MPFAVPSPERIREHFAFERLRAHLLGASWIYRAPELGPGIVFERPDGRRWRHVDGELVEVHEPADGWRDPQNLTGGRRVRI